MAGLSTPKEERRSSQRSQSCNNRRHKSEIACRFGRDGLGRCDSRRGKRGGGRCCRNRRARDRLFRRRLYRRRRQSGGRGRRRRRFGTRRCRRLRCRTCERRSGARRRGAGRSRIGFGQSQYRARLRGRGSCRPRSRNGARAHRHRPALRIDRALNVRRGGRRRCRRQLKPARTLRGKRQGRQRGEGNKGQGKTGCHRVSGGSLSGGRE